MGNTLTSQLLRESNRLDSAKLLVKEGIKFTTHNDGVHLMLHASFGRIDFWPGTGLWKSGSTKGKGVTGLIDFIKKWEKKHAEASTATSVHAGSDETGPPWC